LDVDKAKEKMAKLTQANATARTLEQKKNDFLVIVEMHSALAKHGLQLKGWGLVLRTSLFVKWSQEFSSKMYKLRPAEIPYLYSRVFAAGQEFNTYIRMASARNQSLCALMFLLNQKKILIVGNDGNFTVDSEKLAPLKMSLAPSEAPGINLDSVTKISINEMYNFGVPVDMRNALTTTDARIAHGALKKGNDVEWSRMAGIVIQECLKIVSVMDPGNSILKERKFSSNLSSQWSKLYTKALQILHRVLAALASNTNPQTSYGIGADDVIMNIPEFKVLDSLDKPIYLK